MTRLNLFALVLAGLATLWLVAPSHAKGPVFLEAVSASICQVGGDAADASAATASERPLLFKACAGHKNRLAIPCPSERYLPTECVLALAMPRLDQPPRSWIEIRGLERDEPGGQFRPPRLPA